jgi:hypothetical protein
MLTKKGINNWMLIGIIIFVAILLTVSPVTQAGDSKNSHFYNLMGTFWPPFVSPMVPVTSISTTFVDLLTNNTLLSFGSDSFGGPTDWNLTSINYNTPRTFGSELLFSNNCYDINHLQITSLINPDPINQLKDFSLLPITQLFPFAPIDQTFEKASQPSESNNTNKNSPEFSTISNGEPVRINTPPFKTATKGESLLTQMDGDLPEYIGVDWKSGLAGKFEMPSLEDSPLFEAHESIHSTQSYEVGDWAYDWYIEAISGNPFIQLRAKVGNVEVWVANDDALMFPDGDPRNDDPLNWQITDEMVQYIAEEFNSVMYPIEIDAFGSPFDRDGTGTIFEQVGFPPSYWDWIETDNPQRVILKIFNIHDDNYYDPDYPYYIIGFYAPQYTIDYYNRNMIHIDNWKWWERLGPEGTQWYEGHPELTVTRPYLYEGATAHEYQHNIHEDLQPGGAIFMNEGCSMYAMHICYGLDLKYFNSYFATPDNSLTVFGDQGEINIIADYGVVALWTIYLSDHYGGGELIREYVQSGITGIEGINNALKTLGHKKVTFDDVYRDWKLANLIRSDIPGREEYNYTSIDLNAEGIIPVRVYEESGVPADLTSGTDYGNTITILGYDTGFSEISAYGSDYIAFRDLEPGLVMFDGDDEAIFGWKQTEEGDWYSGGENLWDKSIFGEAIVDGGEPTLLLTTLWDIEPYWDFGFVQVSTDEGTTWTSLENDYTTDDHDPGAHPDIVANLPGLTGTSEGEWVTMSFDLTAYAGQTVLIRFRYMTDWAMLYEGWYIRAASVSGTPLILTPLDSDVLDVDFQVTLVNVFERDGETVYTPIEMKLDDKEETGKSPAVGPSYSIMVVSPRMLGGFVDYAFKSF